jgi:diguanylate cyclase (GGDEF)-like protein
MSDLPRDVLLELIGGSAEPLLVARVDRPDWPVVLANPAFASLAGNVDGEDRPLADVVEPLIGRDMALEVSEIVRARQASSLPVDAGGDEYLLLLRPVPLASASAIRYFVVYWRRADSRTSASANGTTHRALSRANRRIRDLSRDDPATGLLNTGAFREVFTHDWAVAARERSSLALSAFGFDDFDDYLAVFGRHASDSCLRRIAQVIRRNLKRASDVAARIDGEHGGWIIVLSHGSDEDSVREFSVRIAAAVRELGLHHPRSRVARFVTVSFETELLRPADGAKPSVKLFKDLLGR